MAQTLNTNIDYTQDIGICCIWICEQWLESSEIQRVSVFHYITNCIQSKGENLVKLMLKSGKTVRNLEKKWHVISSNCLQLEIIKSAKCSFWNTVNRHGSFCKTVCCKDRRKAWELEQHGRIMAYIIHYVILMNLSIRWSHT